MINKQEEQEISNYLLELKINRQEAFEEFFDHLATSYEKALAKNPATEIKVHLRNEGQSVFGGEAEMKKLFCRKRNEINKVYRSRLLCEFTDFFKGPMLLLSSVIFVLVYFGLMSFGKAHVYDTALLTTVIVMIIPLGTMMYGLMSFKMNCRNLGKGYRSSFKNQMLFHPSFLLTSFFYLLHVLNITLGLDRIVLPLWSIMLIGAFVTVYLIFGFVYLRLIRREFDFKISLG